MPAKTVSSVGCIFVFEFWGVCVYRKMAQDLLACFSAIGLTFPLRWRDLTRTSISKAATVSKAVHPHHLCTARRLEDSDK